LKKKS